MERFSLCRICLSDNVRMYLVADKKLQELYERLTNTPVHTGAKPYTCQYCSRTFSQSNSLKLHVKTVHLKQPANRKSKSKTSFETKIEKNAENHENTEELQIDGSLQAIRAFTR
ncbi:hypothetical protein HF086_002488 [Spodoptera exigua]|uniref:C2H2-type domain-containing protein n=1 Tax=Spodoptera exigua TaxID=7107 RepID=A0A922SGD3_SPOEX|nr:hypothetical protein HF086_002488 [Spodoptera exigua]